MGKFMKGQTERENTARGKIIFLNGVSSSGKTTLARKLQERLEEPFFLFQLDIFFEMMRMPENCYAYSDNNGMYDHDKWLQIENKILSAFHHTIKTFADMGFHTIVDRVFIEQKYVELFHEYLVLFVLVTCPLEELRRREKERGDRDIGQGESQLAELNPQDTYDITVDTHNNTSEECADKIIEMLNYPDKWTAFKTLWEQRTV